MKIFCRLTKVGEKYFGKSNEFVVSFMKEAMNLLLFFCVHVFSQPLLRVGEHLLTRVRFDDRFVRNEYQTTSRVKLKN